MLRATLADRKQPASCGHPMSRSRSGRRDASIPTSCLPTCGGGPFQAVALWQPRAHWQIGGQIECANRNNREKINGFNSLQRSLATLRMKPNGCSLGSEPSSSRKALTLRGRMSRGRTWCVLDRSAGASNASGGDPWITESPKKVGSGMIPEANSRKSCRRVVTNPRCSHELRALSTLSGVKPGRASAATHSHS